LLALGGAVPLAWLISACAPVGVAGDAGAYDANKARHLAAEDRCLRCHGVTRQKEGPAYAEIAAKYRGKPDAEARLYGQLTTGEHLMPDGHIEAHRIIKAKSPDEIRNVVRWILAQ
jgi:cytochrome c